MKNRLSKFVYHVTGAASRDKTILSELERFSEKYDVADRNFIGAYELHLFTGKDVKLIRKALKSLERHGYVKAVPRYLNGVQLRGAGYAINAAA